MEVFRVTENFKKKIEAVWGVLGSGGFVGALGRRVSGAGCDFRAGWHSAGGGGGYCYFRGFFACAGGGNGHWGIILWSLDTFVIFPNFMIS